KNECSPTDVKKMKINIHHLKKLVHCDEHGKFFTKENVSLVLDEQGVLVEYRENQNKNESTLIGLPCFVDAHTHALFAGNRSQEFQMKAQGKSYLDIAKEGGGILHTQKETKKS